MKIPQTTKDFYSSGKIDFETMSFTKGEGVGLICTRGLFQRMGEAMSYYIVKRSCLTPRAGGGNRHVLSSFTFLRLLHSYAAPQHFFAFFPDPQLQGSFGFCFFTFATGAAPPPIDLKSLSANSSNLWSSHFFEIGLTRALCSVCCKLPFPNSS